MTRLTTVDHRFVEFVPKDLEPGVVYVSIEYTTVAHLCCCGCGKRVVLPLHPAQWEITYDGETVSLWPSVGSWDLDCQSHYIIERNRIRWCKQWSREQVSDGRERDRAAVEASLRQAPRAAAADRRQCVRGRVRVRLAQAWRTLTGR